MTCRKCQNEGTITIKNDNCYCKSCYLLYINHKFRACIGKNKVIIPNEKVLIGLTGSIDSTVLLDLIHTGITLNSQKKLRIVPQFVHITGYEDNENKSSQTVEEQCKSYGFEVKIINISTYLSNHIIGCDFDNVAKTLSNDFMKRIKHNILASLANDFQCRLIFTSETANKLATKLLSNLVIGRGSQIENDIGFSDDRYENIKILRPLRDITNEDLQHYMHIKGLQFPLIKSQTQYSLQSIIKNFVGTLEKDSPATISTICKTADKIGHSDNDDKKKCVFCKGNLDNDCTKLTALQATNYSRLVSLPNKRSSIQIDQLENNDMQDIMDESMFPFINIHLCYCCSRSYAEIKKTTLKQHINTLIDK